ncbi:MAG: 6-phosphofructokinase [Eggerthellaceae bacterium]
MGTCRYKLKRDDEADFRRLADVMDAHDIETMFYIGGNDSMDTVDALAEWAHDNAPGKRFIGIPKTVDNDLVPVDHCPGFPSAAKVACEITHATRLDYDAYTRPEVFVLEVMGRDAGWLAASCCVTGDVDLLVLPEVAFDRDAFLAEVRAKFEATGSCYIVVSEGARYADGTYLSAGDTAHDGFAHAVLGGAAQTVKQMIVDTGIVPRGVVQDLSRAARSSNFAQSLVDVTRAYDLGMSAHMRSADRLHRPGGGHPPQPGGRSRGPLRGRAVRRSRKRVRQFRQTLPRRVDPAELPGHYAGSGRVLPAAHRRRAKLVMKGGIPATIVPFNKR